ncbi:sensor histidine kinase [Marinomonas flavescens]|uniref:sensor histidine kinase n=1 Tax=Marinomonas flavescens TaxID=2529379 RepID=UPI001055926D|nr:sensor histidine kinase [Marinomonas flavescens]
MYLILSLLQQMSVYLVLAYMLSKTPIFLPLLNISSQVSHKFSCYVLFSLFCVMGTYFGLSINDAIANTRAIGAVMGGLLGGPIVGFAVGLTGGIHRYSLGGFTDVACAISTTAEGLIGGLLHLYLVKKDKSALLFNPMVVLAVTFVAEVSQMLIIVSVAKPFGHAYTLVSEIAAPMIIANCIGAALFISILHDKKTIYERYSATFSRRALTIAERSVGIWNTGFDATNSEKVARIIYEETNVGAVAITDNEKILAFIGIGDDHHKPNTPISSGSTIQAMEQNRIIYLGGRETPYHCSISNTCKLGSALIIPLRAGKKVVGSIKLYEPKRKLLSNINRSMGEGIAQLLSSQILYGDFQQQQALLTQAEIKLLHAQVNPHFLFNALNTISAVIRRDPDKARELIQHLSHFFRSNLKQNIDTVALKDELAHVNAYLTIEKARFTDRLDVEINIDDGLLEKLLPSFTLQPLVENAIKHGVANRLEGGKVRIYSEQHSLGYKVVVEDNAGNFSPPAADYEGLGMEIVTKRLINYFGDIAELQIDCRKGEFTRMSFLIPNNK